MKKISIDRKWLPLIFLILGLTAFGFYISSLGFYFDDWTNLHYAITAEKASEVYLYHFRPLHVWLDILTVSLLGTSPLIYQILSLLLRFLTVLAFWKVLKTLWPEREEEAAWIAIIFMLYPVFLQQPISFAYREHWTTYLFFMLSILLMLKAYRNKARFWIFTTLSLLTMGIHLLITEYFAMEEFIRPILLWFVVMEGTKERKEKIKTVFKHWIPYLISIGIFFYWRVLIVSAQNEPNPLVFPSEFKANPIRAIFDYSQDAIGDILHVIFNSWNYTISPEAFNFESPFNVFSWVFAPIVGVLLFNVMRLVKFNSSTTNNTQWHIRAIFLGLFAIVISLIPTWAAGKQIIHGNFSDRFGLAPMFGASILIVAILTLIINNKTYRYAIFCILVVLAVNTHLQISNQYRWEWVYQKNIYWQLHWRAPGLQPNTAIITDAAITKTTNRFTASFALNLLYPKESPSPKIDYWLYEIYYNGLNYQIPEVTEKDYIFTFEDYGIIFESDINGAILFKTAKEPLPIQKCMWVLTKRDINNYAIPSDMRDLSIISNPERILNEGSPPSSAIFGSEPDHKWCYYFQKGDLARQMQDWDLVISLFNEAEKNDYRPQNGYEYIPFIEAYAAKNDWDTAQKLSKIGLTKSQKNTPDAPMLCATWEYFKEQYAGEPGFDSAYENIIEQMACR